MKPSKADAAMAWQKRYNVLYLWLESLIDDSEDVLDLDSLQNTLRKLTLKIERKITRLDRV